MTLNHFIEGQSGEVAFNDIDIQIPSNLVFERMVRESAVFVARYLGFDEDRVADLQLAVSEAVTNAIEHGNQSDIHVKVGVKFFINAGQLAVQVSDQGFWESAAEIIETATDELDMEERLERNMTRGMGMFLIEKLADNVDIKSSIRGTEFTMWFNLHQSSQPYSPVSFDIELQKGEQVLN